MLSKLEYKNNQLFFDGINLNTIAKKYYTPIYIYSKSRIIENYKNYDTALKKYFKNYQISFAVKSNNNLTILKLLKKLGAGFDTVSAYEIEKSLLTNINPEKIVFSGVGKNEKELTYAIEQNVGQINIESYEEFLNIIKITKQLKKVANVAIRVVPNIDAHTHRKITTGKLENKFGVDLDTCEDIISQSKNNKFINLKGLSVHIGSQILDMKPFDLTFEYFEKFYKKYKNFVTVDFGGGIGIQYKENDVIPSCMDYVKYLKNHFAFFNGKIILEPGRSIIGDAGIFLTKIVYIKKTANNNFVIVDGGMNNLVRPAMYDAYHHPMLVNIDSNKKVDYTIVGPICETSDTFNKNVLLNEIKQNNYIAFLSAGAYGKSMASNYCLHNIAGELLIDNGKIKEICKPINYKDLLKFEK